MKKQNINKGDKLLCKEGFTSSMINFYKNKEYSIRDIKLTDHNYDYDDYVYEFIDENNKIFTIWYEDELYNYFYTEKEVRKFKLKQLNEEAEY